jgi:hypothetical protein
LPPTGMRSGRLAAGIPDWRTQKMNREPEDEPKPDEDPKPEEPEGDGGSEGDDDNGDT